MVDDALKRRFSSLTHGKLARRDSLSDSGLPPFIPASGIEDQSLPWGICLHQPDGAWAKSLHAQVPLTTKYWGVPLLWLATLALPSGNSSTSPASTSATALSQGRPRARLDCSTFSPGPPPNRT